MLQLLLLLTLSVVVKSEPTCDSPKATFHPISGADCVTSSFTHTVWGSCDPQSCSLHCAKMPNCRAFSLPDGDCLCKLFLFDKCSHRVQSVANCTHRVTVYVRSLPGVAAGRLCPPGYEYSQFGSSYKVSAELATNWADALSRCGQEAGLSKFADALDSDESRHLMWIKNVSNIPVESLYLGGHQIPGSADKTEGWIWDACNESIRADVWEPGRPNKGLPDQGCAGVYVGHQLGVDDVGCSKSWKYLCECLSVF